jgi:hypothetical protein
MFEKKPSGVDVTADVDSGGVRLAACAGTLAGAIVNKKLRVKVCISVGAPVTMREFPLPPGRIIAVGVYPTITLMMANGDLMVWHDRKWVKCYSLADEEHDA